MIKWLLKKLDDTVNEILMGKEQRKKPSRTELQSMAKRKKQTGNNYNY